MEQLASEIARLRDIAAEVATGVLAREAEHVDREAAWPAVSLRAIADAGLLSLHVPRRYGGHDEGLLALAIVSEELGRYCASAAMCFGMHSVACKVLATKATDYHAETYLLPIARGEHISSLALSEPGTGSSFFLPRTKFTPDRADVLLDGRKSFVTGGGHADSYVVSAVPPGSELDPGTFTCFVVDGKHPGLNWQEEWNGLGMRGNSSRSVRFDQVRIPCANMLGTEGDQIWYVFEIVAPYFIVAMSGVYLGIAQAALDEAVAHLQSRTLEHTGETLSRIPALADQVGTMWTAISRTRQLVHHAARLGDAQDPDTAKALFAAKIDVADMVTAVTQQAMILSGGRGFAQNGRMARLLRDAQACHVMGPTTHMLKAWLGRSVLGLPLL